MCSILGVFGLQSTNDLAALRREVVERSRRQSYRGPDESGVYVDEGVMLAHERLAIIDPRGGAQPLMSADGNLTLIANCEIYNHRELRRETDASFQYLTGSDSEVIPALYCEQEPDRFLARLNGIFAFGLWDRAARRFIIARDPIGVCPLYWGRDRSNRLWISSEMKGLVGMCDDAAHFPPGHYFDSRDGELRKYYSRPWRAYAKTRGVAISSAQLRAAFESAVQRQLMSDVPYGVLLSGGLDSSLVTACAARWSARQPGAPKVHSFAIGLDNSPDLRAAHTAAAALGTEHHSCVYSVEEGIDALPEVIRHVETYDVTTIRSAIPTYLLARRIKAQGVKMVLSGEGSDEVFGGYLYFYKAPSAQEFHEETVRKLDALNLYDCLRANKAMMAWGVEMRVPFLDLRFLDVAMQMDAVHKMVPGRRMEKAVLREAFEGYLPEAILWRQKEQFSDGVGYSWLDCLKRHAEESVEDGELASAQELFPINTPQAKEAYLYRKIFERYFPGAAFARNVPWAKSIACSTPAALAWDASFAANPDPSGRSVIGVHQSGQPAELAEATA